MADRILRHYSDKPLEPIRSVKQKFASYRSCYDKPKGFWLSAVGEDDWASWCDSEKFRETDKQLAYDITLSGDSNVLFMSSPEEMHDFTSLFGRYGDHRSQYIRWEAVAEIYQGIIIVPYIWECRMSLDWYYPWDCASGCIWDADAIDSFVLANELVTP